MNSLNNVNQEQLIKNQLKNYQQQNKLLLLAVFVIFLLLTGLVGILAYQNQQLKSLLSAQDNPNQPRVIPSPTSSTKPTAHLATTVPESWNSHKSEVLGIEFKLPQSLSLLERSGQEIPGESGSQYCMIYLGSISLNLVNKAMAGSGACSGGQLTVGATSKNFKAGRAGGFGDLQGYVKQDDQYYALMVGGKKFRLEDGWVEEVTNQYGVKILKVKGVSQFSESMNTDWPVAGTPGEGYFGALVNLTNNQKYYGFNLQMEFDQVSDEQTFDQILASVKFLE